MSRIDTLQRRLPLFVKLTAAPAICSLCFLVYLVHTLRVLSQNHDQAMATGVATALTALAASLLFGVLSALAVRRHVSQVVESLVHERMQIAAELEQHRDHLEEMVAARTAELEEARRSAEAASRAKSAFVANVSHEIRTPMNAIIGFTQALQLGDLNSKQREQLKWMTEAAQHLLGIINDVLDLSKIEAGKLVIADGAFSIDAVLDHVVSLISDKARAKGLRLSREVDSILPLYVRGDAVRLTQVLLNFASNAVKFTDRGSIRIGARQLGSDSGELLVRFEVKDTGVGVEASRLAGLFQAFQQADESTTRRYGGTGLGLAISRRLAEMMGGVAGAESKVGVGSTFWFTVRFRDAANALSHPSADEADAPQDVQSRRAALARDHRGARLLLAEDNLINQEVMRELLAGTGLSLTVASNGRIALELARQGHYDLILMDVQMPEMDGLEAARRIRALPNSSIPIIALTANAYAEDRALCIEAGMDDHIAKPLSTEALYSTLSKWLPHAAPPGDADPAQRLESVAGLDVALARELLEGAFANYPDLLRKYLAAHQHPMERLLACIEAGQLDEARRIVHLLKGSSAALGVAAVQQTAARLEEALSSDEGSDRIASLAQQLTHRWTTLTSDLLQALRQDRPDSPAAW